MEIIDVECAELNKRYLDEKADELVRSFRDLLGPGKIRKKAKYL